MLHRSGSGEGPSRRGREMKRAKEANMAEVLSVPV
jgi:hypothetical protein